MERECIFAIFMQQTMDEMGDMLEERPTGRF